MSSALLVLLVAVNPVAIAAELGGRPDRRVLTVGLAATAVLSVVLAGASEVILDVLSVTAPTFRVAAGAVLLLAAARWVALGPRRLPPEDALLSHTDRSDPSPWSSLVVPLLVPVLVSPQLVMAVISVGADDGVLAVAVGAGAAMALSGVACLLHRGSAGIWSTAVRFTGLPAATVAVGLIVDGVKTV